MSIVPQFGFVELFLLAAVALIVVGPQDLPSLMRKVGQFVGKVRGLAREFQSSFDQMAREAELKELREEIEAIKNNNPVALAKREMDAAMRDADATLADVESATGGATAGAPAHDPSIAVDDTQDSEPPVKDDPNEPVRGTAP